MKPVYLLATALLLSQLIKGQVATYTPLNSRFTDTITLYFNLNLATGNRSADLLDRTEGLYLWMGAGTGSNPFEYTPAAQTDFAQPVAGAALTRVGRNLWQITLCPAQWCGVPAGKNPAVLGLIVKNADGTAQTEDIVLTATTQQTLQQVVVRAQKPFIEKQADKTVLNLQSDMAVAGGTLLEALQRAPGISLGNNDALIMSGKSGVLVLIDERPTQMSPEDLSNWLRSSPAALAATIEIITNPSGRYDAQGNAGIINIRLKKATLRGLNGNINAAYSQMRHYRANAAGNLNYRQGKWNLFTNLSHQQVLQHTTGLIERQVYENNQPTQFVNHTTDIDRGTGTNIRLGADLYLNRRSTLGVLVRLNTYHNPMQTPGTTAINKGMTTQDLLQTLNKNTYTTGSVGYSLNYQWRDTAGNQWSADADFSGFDNVNTGNINTQNTALPGSLAINQQRVDNRISIWALRTDYVRQMKKAGLRLEAGLKTTTAYTRNHLQAAYLHNGGMHTDSGRTNRFSYREQVNAAYITLQATRGKWQAQLSLRGEHTRLLGKSIDLKNTIINRPDTAYFNLFPSAFLRYAPHKHHSFGLSASRRINRPSFQDLNPFEFLFDPYTAERGNPYLRPSYLTNAELNYNYRGALDVTLGHSQTRDYYQSIAVQQGNRAYAEPVNIGRQYNWYLNTGIGLPVKSWWFSYNSLNTFYNSYRGSIPSGNLRQQALGMGWYTNQSFTLPKSWKLQLSSWGNIATRDALFATKWLGSIDASVGKSWKEGRWEAKLTVLDIANTQRWHQTVRFANLDFTYYRKWESRGVRLQLNVKLGKTNYAARERKQLAEEDRIRQKS